MARKVFISSDISVDERVAEVALDRPDLALLWPWLLTAFDDWGRAEGHPVRLKAKVFPMMSNISPEIIADALEAFAQAGLLIRYTQHAHEYIAVPAEKWWRYQTHIHHTRRNGVFSQYPAPPGHRDVKGRPSEISEGLTAILSCRPRNLDESRRQFMRFRGILVSYLLTQGNLRCAKCGKREGLEADHITPLSKGGSNEPNNLQFLCKSCNRAKGNRVEGST